MAKDSEPQLRLAIQCPPICEHVCEKDNIDYATSRCATNGLVTIIWEFKCKVCQKSKRINQDRFGVFILSAHLKENPSPPTAKALVARSGPEKPYSLSDSDKRFLKSLRVTPEETIKD